VGWVVEGQRGADQKKIETRGKERFGWALTTQHQHNTTTKKKKTTAVVIGDGQARKAYKKTE